MCVCVCVCVCVREHAIPMAQDLHDNRAGGGCNQKPPPAIRSRLRGPEDPGHQQPPWSTEPRKPTAGTTTHPPRRLQRKPPERAPISIGQRPTRGPGATAHRPRQAPAAQAPASQAWAAHRTRAPGARAPPNPPGRGPTQYPGGPSAPDSHTVAVLFVLFPLTCLLNKLTHINIHIILTGEATFLNLAKDEYIWFSFPDVLLCFSVKNEGAYNLTI